MPKSPLHPCSHPGCGVLSFVRYCSYHEMKYLARAAKLDRIRGTSHERGYGQAWRKLREQVLREEPLCKICLMQGAVTPATDVDHKIPKSMGGTDARTNLQSLCSTCHSRKTATEDGGYGNERSSYAE